jgi:hypothetical protein
LGYGPYEKRGGLLNFLIRYDTFVSGMQYLSYALAGMAYMGVGRNMMYSRDLFYRTKGFISHYRLSSGDDDLFINMAASKGNTTIEIDPSSHVYSIAKSNLPQWLYQKKRHYTTAKYYRPKYKYLLSASYLSKFLAYALLPVLLIWNYNPLFVAGAFVFYYLNHLLILQLCANKLNERDLFWFSPVLEVVLLVVSPLLYFTNILVKPERWK